MISIIVPTIKGRSDYLRECLTAYAATTTDYELHVVPNQDSCGKAWLKAANNARGDFIHFSADDLRPHAGWWQAASEVVGRGFLPAPRILSPGGSTESCGEWATEHATGTQTEFTRIPFLSRLQWERIRPLVETFLSRAHYFTDNAISWAGRQYGWDTGVHRDYLFTHHHLSQQDRGLWGRRMAQDHRLWLEHLGRLEPDAVLQRT